MWHLREECISGENSGETPILSSGNPNFQWTQCPSAPAEYSCWLSRVLRNSEAPSVLSGHLQRRMLPRGSGTHVLICPFVSKEMQTRVWSVFETSWESLKDGSVRWYQHFQVHPQEHFHKDNEILQIAHTNWLIHHGAILLLIFLWSSFWFHCFKSFISLEGID